MLHICGKACSYTLPSQVGSYLPYEFTHEGMLQRLNAYIQVHVGASRCEWVHIGASRCMSVQVGSYLPYEFTHEGMLQRLNAYIQHQDFCAAHPEVWPPTAAVNLSAAPPGKSCKAHCWDTGQSSLSFSSSCYVGLCGLRFYADM